MKLTMNQMQQQALFATQHKKCKCTVGINIYNDKCTPLTISFYDWKGNDIARSKSYYINDDNKDFNEAIQAINGELDPFEEEENKHEI